MAERALVRVKKVGDAPFYYERRLPRPDGSPASWSMGDYWLGDLIAPATYVPTVAELEPVARAICREYLTSGKPPEGPGPYQQAVEVLVEGAWPEYVGQARAAASAHLRVLVDPDG